MKKLFLIRHAKSGSKEHGLTDHERPLSARGESDAPLMAKALKKLKIAPDLMITSDAARAYRTAEIFAEILHYSKKEIRKESELYLADIRDFIRQVNLLDDKFSIVFIVSHNPGISEFAYYLTGEALIDLPTCGVFGVDLEADNWRMIRQGTGKSLLFEYPQKYKEL